jgi:tetratricopeptide (TPR) repeat protein
LLVKVPLGLLALAAAGMTLMRTRRCPRRVELPLYSTLGLVMLFLVFLARSNAGYAGVRHALVVMPPMAMLGALALKTAPARNRRVLRGFVLLAVLAALVSALPVMRPWEYYNELVGGAQNAWRYCNDEGLDLRQRTAELIRYYDEHIRGTEEAVYDEYGISDEQKTRHGLKFWSWQDDLSDSDMISGTVFISAKALSLEPIYDYAALRQAQPVARFGNLLIFHGTFHLPWLRATNRLARALEILSSEQKDVAAAERLLTESIALYPQDYRVALELGNLLAARGARQEAIRAYELARSNAPRGDKMVDLLTRQIDQITIEPSEQVPPLRNAWLE